MRPRTRTQCQDGHPGSPAASTSEAEAPAPPKEEEAPSPSVDAPDAADAGDTSDCGDASSIAAVRDDESVFAVPVSAAAVAAAASGKRGASSASSTSSASFATALGMQGSTAAGEAAPPRELLLVELPAEVLMKVLSFLTYKDVSGLRTVSRRFNELCASVLNSTFQKQQQTMLNRLQSIKAKMPRRESARRNHPLARESDIVETMHMRLSLLQMTFGKHIERKHVCFFAGDVSQKHIYLSLALSYHPFAQFS